MPLVPKAPGLSAAYELRNTSVNGSEQSVHAVCTVGRMVPPIVEVRERRTKVLAPGRHVIKKLVDEATPDSETGSCW